MVVYLCVLIKGLIQVPSLRIAEQLYRHGHGLAGYLRLGVLCLGQCVCLYNVKSLHQRTEAPIFIFRLVKMSRDFVEGTNSAAFY